MQRLELVVGLLLAEGRSRGLGIGCVGGLLWLLVCRLLLDLFCLVGLRLWFALSLNGLGDAVLLGISLFCVLGLVQCILDALNDAVRFAQLLSGFHFFHVGLLFW